MSNPVVAEIHTCFICHTMPFCACVGHYTEWDECCCAPGADGLTEVTSTCVGCAQKLTLIDFSTGKPVAVRPS